jgi:hypothetical protein
MKTEENKTGNPLNSIFFNTIKGKTSVVKELISSTEGEELQKMINFKDV